MNRTLELVHFQITRFCNLHCRFCGQWGENGVFKNFNGREMTRADWERLLAELATLPRRPRLLLWGGEPLMSSNFDAIARRAYDAGFELEIVTNGTLIDRHAELLKRCFKTIYVSIDGNRTTHDAIRGTGVFDRVKHNLELLADRDGELVAMSVLAPETMDDARNAPWGMPVDRVILHELIYLTPSECANFDAKFGAEWRMAEAAGTAYKRKFDALAARLRTADFPVPVEVRSHTTEGVCREPDRHLHVFFNGEVGFCTDFTEFPVGSVFSSTLVEIFNSPEADNFRRMVATGRNPFCAHCSWKSAD